MYVKFKIMILKNYICSFCIYPLIYKLSFNLQLSFSVFISPTYTKEDSEPEVNDSEEYTSNLGMTTSELILNVFRTALDVVRKINKNRSRSPDLPSSTNATVIQVSFKRKMMNHRAHFSI